MAWLYLHALSIRRLIRKNGVMVTYPILMYRPSFAPAPAIPFAAADELEAAASKLPNAVIHQLEGADHGFAVLKSSGRTQKDVWIEAADYLLSWLSRI